jgi:hypothetical protein
LNSGAITGAATLTVTGSFNWNGASTMGGVGGTTVIPSGATLTIAGGGGARAVDARTLNIQGTATWSGAEDWQLNDGATVNNSGSFTIDNDQRIQEFVSASNIFNTGTWTKISPTGTGTTTIDCIFNNSGTANVTSGVLAVDGGGANSGIVNVAAGQTLDLTSGTFALNSGSTLSGTGNYSIDGGTMLVNTSVAPVNVNLNSGTLTGPSTLTVSGAFHWNGASSMAGAGGTTTIASGATLTIANGGGDKVLDARTLNIAGTATWSGASNWQVNDGATVNNSGTFTINNDQNINNFGGTSTIVNTGTWVKTSPTGSGTTTIVPVFNNKSTVNVTSGVLDLDSGTASAAFNVSSGAVLGFVSGVYNFNTGTTLSGAGTANVNGGTLNLIGTAKAANFEIDAGTLEGGGTLTTTAVFTWTGGNIADPNGSVIMPKGSTLNITGNNNKSLGGGTLSLSGMTNWLGSGNISVSNNGTFNNNVGAVFSIQNGASMTGGGLFNNLGILKKASGASAAVIGITLNNPGTLYLATNQALTLASAFTNTGILTVNPGSVLTVAGSFTQSASGTLNVVIGGTSAKPHIGSIVSTTGQVTLNGTLNVTVNSNTITPAVGTALTLLNNMGGSPINGIFDGLPEGATFTVNGMTFAISYVGGTGHSVVITRTA